MKQRIEFLSRCESLIFNVYIENGIANDKSIQGSPLDKVQL